MPENNKKYPMQTTYAVELADLSCFSVSPNNANSVYISIVDAKIPQHNLQLIHQSLTTLCKEECDGNVKAKIANALRSYVQAGKSNPWIKAISILSGIIIGAAFICAIPLGLSLVTGITLGAAMAEVSGFLSGMIGMMFVGGYTGAAIATPSAKSKAQKIKNTEEALQKLVNPIETSFTEENVSSFSSSTQSLHSTPVPYATPANMFGKGNIASGAQIPIDTQSHIYLIPNSK